MNNTYKENNCDCPQTTRRSFMGGMGTGLAGVALSSMLARDSPFAERELAVRQATDDDMARVQQLYRRVAPGYSGFLDRGPYIWPRLTDERFGVPAFGLLVEADDQLEGYVYYRKVRGDGERHSLQVTDLLGRTPEAIARVWTVP